MQYPCGVANSTAIHRHIYNLLFNLTRAPQIGMVKAQQANPMFDKQVQQALDIGLKLRY